MFRRTRSALKVALITLCGLLLLVVPGLGQASYGTTPHAKETVEGEVLLLHSDDFARQRDKEWNAVRTKRGELVKVDLAQVADAHTPLPGERVRLTGERRNGVFLAVDAVPLTETGTTQTTQTTTLAATTTATTRQTAVILLNFTNDASQPWTPSAVSDVMFGETNSVNAYYKETSYGNTSFAGSVFGWVTIPYDNTSCDYWTWGNAAQQALGIDTTKYDNIVYMWPQAASCGWGGMGQLFGKLSWINGWLAVRPLAHEVGHTMGVHHSGSLECTVNGARVTISSPDNCDRIEYGDPFSVMGGTTRQWTNWNRAQVGWIPEKITITRAGTYTVAPEEFSAQPRLLRVARGDGNYFYFEFRQPSGAYDNFSATDPAVNGVLVRLAPDTTTVAQSALVDMTPATSTRNDAALLVGQTFSDPVSGISVTTTAVAPQGATIDVSFGGGSTGGGDTTAPAAPTNLTAKTTSTSIALAWTASSDNVGVAGYRVSRESVLLNTTTATTYNDSGLTTGTTYRYSISAFDAVGNKSAESWIWVTTPAPVTDTTPPKTPSSLKALVIGTTQVALSWVASTDDVGVEAYDVYRDGAKVAQTTLPNFLDTGLLPGSTHKYQVLARDAAGNSSALSSAVSPRLAALSTATTGTVAGVVYNALGRPQSNVVVQLTGNGLAKSAKTGNSGTYKFGSLPAGSYSLTINWPATTTATTAASSGGLTATVVSGVTFVLAT
jgi:chitodextrinase